MKIYAKGPMYVGLKKGDEGKNLTQMAREHAYIANHNIETELKEHIGIDLSRYSNEYKVRIVKSFAATRIAMEDFADLVAEAENDATETRDELTSEDAENVASVVYNVLIPMIDPGFEHRSDAMQRMIVEAVTEFYYDATHNAITNVEVYLDNLVARINAAIENEGK